ncbi:MAG: efflux RND transporter permease subunit, partial [Saprospiraceae bacterium]|nr:efflux RND transporter permease subunit [Saprospiraceae bacterium]
ASFEFTQPIQLRFNELMTGAKTDIAVKIFGEDPALLHDLAEDAARLIRQVEGAGDVKVEQTEGLPQLIVRFDRQKLAQYGLDIETLNQIVRAAYAGEKAGVIFENERKFDLVLRLQRSS